MKASRRNTKGITVLEVMMALAVSALVLVGVIAFYQSARQTSAATKIVNDMNAILSAYKAYVAQGNILVLSGNNGVPMTTLQLQGFLPTPLNDPWGQTYVAVSCSPIGNTEIVIGIQSLGPPEKDKTCNAVKSAVNGSAKVIGGGDCGNRIGNPQCGFVYAF